MIKEGNSVEMGIILLQNQQIDPNPNSTEKTNEAYIA